MTPTEALDTVRLRLIGLGFVETIPTKTDGSMVLVTLEDTEVLLTLYAYESEFAVCVSIDGCFDERVVSFEWNDSSRSTVTEEIVSEAYFWWTQAVNVQQLFEESFDC